jgi:MFS family permease
MLTPAQLRNRTYNFERLRGVAGGIIESAQVTFLLLIAVRALDADPISKSLIVAGGNIGYMLTPIVVDRVSHLGLGATRASSILMFVGALSMSIAALFTYSLNQLSLPIYIACCVVGIMCTALNAPLSTQMYQENYPARERGRLYSRANIIRIGVSAIFSELAGRILNVDILWFRWLLVIFAIAFAFSGICYLKIPTHPMAVSSHSRNPYHSLKYLREDRLFRWLTISWTILGAATLVTMPLRVEYLANPRYGLALDAQQVAFYVGVIPSVCRLIMSPIWGIIFDKFDFFTLRIATNIGFMVGILSFFTGNSTLGLWVGAIALGVASAGGDLTWSLWVTKFTTPDKVADYMAVHTFITGIRSTIAPIIAFQIVYAISIEALGYISAIMIIIASLMLLPEVKRGRRAVKSTIGKQ